MGGGQYAIGDRDWHGSLSALYRVVLRQYRLQGAENLCMANSEMLMNLAIRHAHFANGRVWLRPRSEPGIHISAARAKLPERRYPGSSSQQSTASNREGPARCRTRWLSTQRRQECLPLRREVLIDSIHHEAHSEIVAHDHHELHRVLPPEMSDHLLPQLAAHAVLAIQRASESDERRVLVGEACHVLVVLDDVDDRLLKSLPQARGLVGGPLILLVDFSR